MKRNFLEKLFKDLEAEDTVKKNIIDQIMDENGKEVTTLKTEIANLKEDVSVKDGVIETKNAKIAEFEKVDIEKIKEQEYERGKTDGSVELDNFKKTNALKNSIKGAKDFDLVKTKLDLDKIKYEKDEKGEYKVSGVDEQIKDIKEKYSFLFDDGDDKKDINLGGEHKKTTETDGLKQLEEAMGIKTEK